MDRAIENFVSPSQNSSLVKSFWAGMLLRELRMDGNHGSDHKHESSQDPLPTILTPHLCMKKTPTSTLVSDAVQALTMTETSLSPSVHQLVTMPVPLEELQRLGQADQDDGVLDSNAMLNLSIISHYLLGGNDRALIVFILFIFYKSFPCVGLSDESPRGPRALFAPDIAAGAYKCKVLAHCVYRKICADEKLIDQLKDVSNFLWTSQPQVSNKKSKKSKIKIYNTV